MHRSLAGVAVAAAMSLSSAVLAEEPRASEPQGLNVSSAMPACFVDTPNWDYLSAYACSASGSAYSTIVSWGVLGIDQTGGRYTIQFLDSCYGHGYYQDTGYSCMTVINKYDTLTQRIRVYDNLTGQWSATLTATASYYGDD
ncbi:MULTISPECIES: hypothetical protein [unclassified Myxococcus]|uniref:hypothetical protein n=1 Tax=unclassified Myxococcus TaxID=2648731 RepID=UPI00157A30EC|nr:MULTISPECIES: hypothetical protein [unclassified Myxococcus]NTX01716.1 hypothetical protein [Myxococcus sp. CA040A]NTX16355.1 hypothetical protein [Myxococcus sp. CA056]NTX50885.1 hypothetical protein [Myxococcus sp. CA039A]